MFEQSTIAPAQRSKRLWTTCVGFGGQAMLVGFAFLAPMLWPQILPHTTLTGVLLTPGPPPGPPPAGQPMVRPRTAQRRPMQFNKDAFTAPASIPAHVAIINDPAPEVSQGPGVPGGVPGGSNKGAAGGILNEILAAGDAPPRPVEQPRVTIVPTPPAAPQRVRMGGNVKGGRLLHRVEPQYPPIARQMRISGTVVIEGVVGVDGRIRELRIVEGHPMLVKAALEAVRQWIYEPMTLNGDPVEVIAPITVTFRLN
jgi:periplasmic protein TonB